MMRALFRRVGLVFPAVLLAVTVTTPGVAVGATTSTATRDWTSLGGFLTAGPAVAVDHVADSVFHFVRGADGAVWRYVEGNASDGLGAGWQSLGGHSIGGPGAMWFPDGTGDYLVIVVQGLDHALWFNEARRTNADYVWHGWASIGGIITDDPAVANLNGGLDFFARGQDGALWYNHGGGGWASLGGHMIGGPGAHGRATRDPNLYGVVAVQGLDHALWTRTVAFDLTFGPWTDNGGSLVSDPDVTLNPQASPVNDCPSSVYAVAEGDDGALWAHDVRGWSSHGGRLTAGPAVDFDGPDFTNDKFFTQDARGTDGALWTRTDELTPAVCGL